VYRGSAICAVLTSVSVNGLTTYDLVNLCGFLQLRTSPCRPHSHTDVMVHPAAIDDPTVSHSWAVNYPVRCLKLAALIMIPHCHLSQSASVSSPIPIGYKVDVGHCPPPPVFLRLQLSAKSVQRLSRAWILA